MTNLLVRLFVQNHEDTENPAVRAAYGKMAGLVGIVANLLLSVAKFIIGTLAGSVSIAADAVNNLSDAASSIVNLLGFKLAERPADDGHPYGHARFEYLSGLAVAVMVLLIGAELAKTGVQKILNPSPIAFSPVVAVVLVLSIVAKLWLAVFNRNLGNRIHSGSLFATAADSRNDVVTTSAVLVAACVGHFTGLMLDGWMSLAVAIFILYSGYQLVRETIDPLLGRAPDPELVSHIQHKILSYPGVLGTHDLMLHDYGPGCQFASAHVEMAAEDDVMQSHEVIDTIERDFLENDRLQVVLHFDPIITGDEQVGALRKQVSGAVKEIDEQLSIHDFRMVVGPNRQNLIFDCVVPAGYALPDAQLKTVIQEAVSQLSEGYVCVITIDHSYVSVQTPQQ